VSDRAAYEERAISVYKRGETYWFKFLFQGRTSGAHRYREKECVDDDVPHGRVVQRPVMMI
jgi:hypothetical protein